MTRAGSAISTWRSGPNVLAIYLNDHLAGATAGAELARRAAGSAQDHEDHAVLRGFAAEVAQDRIALLNIMATLGIPVRTYKVYAGWIGEKAGRLKFNGRLFTRSPLSRLEELELLRLGVEGKAAGWRTLRVLADTDQRLEPARLDELMARRSGSCGTGGRAARTSGRSCPRHSCPGERLRPGSARCPDRSGQAPRRSPPWPPPRGARPAASVANPCPWYCGCRCQPTSVRPVGPLASDRGKSGTVPTGGGDGVPGTNGTMAHRPSGGPRSRSRTCHRSSRSRASSKVAKVRRGCDPSQRMTSSRE